MVHDAEQSAACTDSTGTTLLMLEVHVLLLGSHPNLSIYRGFLANLHKTCQGAGPSGTAMHVYKRKAWKVLTFLSSGGQQAAARQSAPQRLCHKCTTHWTSVKIGVLGTSSHVSWMTPSRLKYSAVSSCSSRSAITSSSAAADASVVSAPLAAAAAACAPVEATTRPQSLLSRVKTCGSRGARIGNSHAFLLAQSSL